MSQRQPSVQLISLLTSSTVPPYKMKLQPSPLRNSTTLLVEAFREFAVQCRESRNIKRCLVVTLNPLKHNVSQKQGHCSSKTSIWRVILYQSYRNLGTKAAYISQIESLAHFHRERIPERVKFIPLWSSVPPFKSYDFNEQVVHAKANYFFRYPPKITKLTDPPYAIQGAGAHGYFETTTDVGKNYSMADVFQRVGEKTPITSA